MPRRRRDDAPDEPGVPGAPWMGPLPASAGCDCHVCRPEPPYDDLDRSCIDAVLQHGWQVLLVADSAGCACCAGDEPDPGQGHHDVDDVEPAPAFAYTVGLGHRADHPELVMSGLDPALMHRSLNALARRVLDGRRIAPGDAVEGILGGVPLVVERVAAEGLRETVTWSGWFHRRRPEALVLVWPTVDGLFPWQPGAPAILDERQPPTWRENLVHTGGVATDPEWVLPAPPEQLVFSCTHVVDDREAVLWAARESDPERGEDWTIHCGEDDHATDDVRLTHLAHLVRSAPSLRTLAALGLDEEAWRDTPDAGWAIGSSG